MYQESNTSLNPFYEKIISEYLTKGYSIVENWLEIKETDLLKRELANLNKEDKFRKSAIGNKFTETVKKSIRGDFIYWLDETKYADAFFLKINDFVNYLNKTCFAGIISKEFHYAIYPTGAFYKKHIDTFQNDDRRVISIVCYLNKNWTINNGGQLKLYLDNETKEIFPTNGKIVIFDSKTIEHEVLPILSGKRLSITGWLKTS